MHKRVDSNYMFGLNFVKVGSEVWTLELVTNIHFTKTSSSWFQKTPKMNIFYRKKSKLNSLYVCIIGLNKVWVQMTPKHILQTANLNNIFVRSLYLIIYYLNLIGLNDFFTVFIHFSLCGGGGFDCRLGFIMSMFTLHYHVGVTQ